MFNKTSIFNVFIKKDWIHRSGCYNLVSAAGLMSSNSVTAICMRRAVSTRSFFTPLVRHMFPFLTKKGLFKKAHAKAKNILFIHLPPA
jgi:hypothetical protein